MKLTRIFVVAAAAATIAGAPAVAAPNPSAGASSESTAVTNALRSNPSAANRGTSKPSLARTVVTTVSRGAVWLPKARGR